MRYRLRTLLILLAVLPPLIALAWWALTRNEHVSERVSRLTFRFIGVPLIGVCCVVFYFAVAGQRTRPTRFPRLSTPLLDR
jgi:hypothetical protein